MDRSKLRILMSKFKIVLPLLIVQAYGSSADVLAPILNNMQVAFPEASMTLVQMTLTLPSAVSIPVQLLTVLLAQKMTKKDMMSLALFLICGGGLIPLFLHGNIIWVVISSVVIGIGQGFFTPAINALASDMFDGNVRAAFLGIKGGTTAFLRTLMTVAVGFFGVAVWSRAYLIFVFLIPFIALFMYVTPKGEKSAKIVGKGIGLSGFKQVITPAFIIITLLCSFASCCQMAYTTNISGFIAEQNMGNSVTAGAASAFFTMSKFIVGLCLGFLMRAFKRFTLPLGYALCAGGYLIISLATGLTGVQIGGIIFGVGLGVQTSGGLYYVTETVDKKYLSQMMGIYFPAISLLISISPLVINSIAKLVYGSVSATNNFKAGCLGYAAVALLMFLYQLFFCKDSMIGKISGLEEAPEPSKTSK